MRNVFLFENLILENRLDSVIKKYPEVDRGVIEDLSGLDPSGNNKYLDWMVFGIVKLGIAQSRIINGINSFHKNINKLTKEFLDDFVRTRNLGWLLTDNSPVAKIFQNIYNNPKDISVYKDYGLALDIFKTVNEKIEFYSTFTEYEHFLWKAGATLEGINFYRFKFAEMESTAEMGTSLSISQVSDNSVKLVFNDVI
jgi:hypothetical protein